MPTDPTTGEILDETAMQPSAAPTTMTFFTKDMPPETVAAAQKQLGMVFAHVTVARANPRDLVRVEKQMLAHCNDPYFALAAEFVMPRAGKAIRGLSVRFAEAAFQELGNMGLDIAVMNDDAMRRTIKVTLHDYQNNTERSEEETFDKTVERSDPGDRRIVSTRTNSKGNPIATVLATSAEVAQLQGIAASKLGRNLVLRMLSPEFKRRCHIALRAAKVAAYHKDPEFVREMLLDVAGRLNIDEDELLEYIGVDDWKKATKDDLLDLGEALESVQSGNSKWWPMLKDRREFRQRAEREAKKSGGNQPQQSAAPTNGNGQQAPAGSTEPDEFTRAFDGPAPTQEPPPGTATMPAATPRMKSLGKVFEFRGSAPEAFGKMMEAIGRPVDMAPSQLTDAELDALLTAITKTMERGAKKPR